MEETSNRHHRNRWIVMGVVLVMIVVIFWLCVGLAVGFTIGNLVGENAVCEEVWDHAENPSDVPTCADPWW